MTVKGVDNVGIVLESIDEVISFFAERGLTLEGRFWQWFKDNETMLLSSAAEKEAVFDKLESASQGTTP